MAWRLMFRIALVLLTTVTVGCAKTASLADNAPPEDMYQAAVEDMEDGLYPEAIKTFEVIRSRYPYAAVAALADLRIADVHFRSARYLEAIEGYRMFVQFHPRHPEAPYAAFKIGEAHMKRAPRDWWFMPPAYEKDLAAVRQGVVALREFITSNADTAWAEDARALMREGRRRLGEHELYVARFYLAQEAWRAASGRADGILADYRGTGLEPLAYMIAARALRAQGDNAAAAERLQGLIRDFPGSDEAREAASLLEDIGPIAAPISTPNPASPAEDDNG